jgi:protein transport protein SEC20
MILITRLSKLSAPGAEGETARTELAQLIHQMLREAETEYELLVDEAGMLQHAHDSAGGGGSGVPSLVSKTGEDLKIARRQYRKALLTAKRNSAAAEREALLAGRRKQIEGGGNEKVSQKDVLVSASSDVTAALRRTQQLLQGELSRSRFASETLAQSTEALKELSERYSAFDDILGKSRELIRDLIKKNKSDRWYFEKAIQILLGTLIWIVVRRLFWGPIWLFVVWPLKTIWWICASAVGLGTGTRNSAETSMVMSSMSPVMATPTVIMSSSGLVASVNPVDEVQQEMGGEADAEDAQNMREVVGKIIDGESTTITRNTKSRRFEESTAEQTPIPPAEEFLASEAVTAIPEQAEPVKEPPVNVEIVSPEGAMKVEGTGSETEAVHDEL